mmetsp:Transcript_1061/g.1968  ORF Transcript_1061/g.1968 Transcript_1061/m.1968 type:complete len:144 (+) Transcript_1061:939-1370(+)
MENKADDEDYISELDKIIDDEVYGRDEDHHSKQQQLNEWKMTKEEQEFFEYWVEHYNKQFREMVELEQMEGNKTIAEIFKDFDIDLSDLDFDDFDLNAELMDVEGRQDRNIDFERVKRDSKPIHDIYKVDFKDSAEVHDEFLQ